MEKSPTKKNEESFMQRAAKGVMNIMKKPSVEEDEYGGLGFEYVNDIALAIKNYISRDPEGMMKVGENQQKSHLD